MSLVKTIGLGSITGEESVFRTASGYEKALKETLISQEELYSLMQSVSGIPHHKIDPKSSYYAPCAGDTSVFLLPRQFDCEAHRICGYALGAIGDLLIWERFHDHFHVTCRGFGTMPVLEGDLDLIRSRSEHEKRFRSKFEDLVKDASIPRSFRLIPHDIAMLGTESAIAVVIRHKPVTDADADGMYRVFRTFDSVVEDEGYQAGATWHTTLAYRNTIAFSDDDCERFAKCLSELSDMVAGLPCFELSLEDLVYWQFSNMDDFHEVGTTLRRSYAALNRK